MSQFRDAKAKELGSLEWRTGVYWNWVYFESRASAEEYAKYVRKTEKPDRVRVGKQIQTTGPDVYEVAIHF